MLSDRMRRLVVSTSRLAIKSWLGGRVEDKIVQDVDFVGIPIVESELPTGKGRQRMFTRKQLVAYFLLSSPRASLSLLLNNVTATDSPSWSSSSSLAPESSVIFLGIIIVGAIIALTTSLTITITITIRIITVGVITVSVIIAFATSSGDITHALTAVISNYHTLITYQDFIKLLTAILQDGGTIGRCQRDLQAR
ncbi:hypothetical protein FRB95_001111 [Tulasnella sp. JGI-2019a]|nr:hypothetical protein FRB95_001111 [Tulasnella sp. JGI-2019a]